MHKLGSTLAATVGITLAVTLVAPAHAAVSRFTDPADVHHGVDLRRVTVTNGEENLWVRLKHTNLRRSPSTGSAATVYVDTNRKDPGPEFVFTAGLFEGTDYAFLRTDGFGHRQWGDPVHCSYRLRIDYAEDVSRMRISQDCFGDRQRARVAVRASGQRTDGTAVVDWLGRPRELTPWIHRG
jgi:hypothetical protein